MTTAEQRAHADERYAKAMTHHGCRIGLGRIIVKWARVYGVPISLAFALFRHESGFRKVFGHDPTIFVGAGPVTRAKYLLYRKARRASGNTKMQGVGEGQLTWWATQDRADEMGGAWTAEANVRVALMTLGALIHQLGVAKGVERYNGSGPQAVAYSRAVRAEADLVHSWLS